ncbi:hypothetical protein VdG1_04431 [Verticillium dahliae VDG1]|nr:hypothetical protein VdG1_04431 [Verticillium dahliae VDG1]
MNRLFSRVLPAPAAIPHISTAPIHTSAPCHAQRIYPTNYTPKGIGLSPIKPRKPAPPPPGWTPFAISNLLLDLDAYESRYGERLLEWLLHRQAQLDETLPPDAVALESRIEPRETTRLDAEAGGSSANAGQQRPEWSGFLSWKRLVTAILQTETGVAILAKRKEELARTMEGLLTPENALDQLVFLNNLHARFHADGVELGLHLCGAGLVLAAEARQGRALTRYLSLGAGSGYWRASTSREGASAAIPDLMLQNLRAVLVKADDGSISFDGSASKLLVALDSDAAVAGSSIEQLAPAGRQPQAASS